MSFFPEGTHPAKSNYPPNPLVPVVRPLPLSARQAMYAATKKGVINRGTWDNCAWNAAGAEHGKSVRSLRAAAEVFSCSVKVVEDFIRRWDNLRCRDDKANSMLVSALEEIGFEDTSAVPAGLTRVVVGYAFKGTATEFLEKLDSVDNISDMGFDEELLNSVNVLLNA